jgi:peptidyl-prolyl cis-trans isomerase B (cyclophilin B)
MPMKKGIALILIAVLCLVLLASCGKKEPEATASPYLSGRHYAELVIRDYGTIYLELDADTAPISVTNFLNLANSGFYDGLTFHRIIEGFMMQGGGFDAEGSQKKADSIKGEFAKNGVTNNIDHDRGVISMARASEFNSASSQFFIMHKSNPNLDGVYAAFGHVIKGMDIVDKICENTPVQDANGSVALADRPVIQSIREVDAASLADLELDAPLYLSGLHHVELVIKDYGTISLELDADTAPISVTNFINLAKEGFYDGLTFHRIIEGFMMQGGGFDQAGNYKPSDNIKGEFAQNGVTNGIAHDRGVISMARANDPNSASSQFFIMHKKADHLDGAYAAFGHVTEGMDIVDKICENTPVQDKNGSVALEDRPVIETVRVID